MPGVPRAIGLSWFGSYLGDSQLFIPIGEHQSHVSQGVLQGSVIGPLSFIIDILHQHGLRFEFIHLTALLVLGFVSVLDHYDGFLSYQSRRGYLCNYLCFYHTYYLYVYIDTYTFVHLSHALGFCS